MKLTRLAGVRDIGVMRKRLYSTPPEHIWSFHYHFGATRTVVEAYGWALSQWLSFYEDNWQVLLVVSEQCPDGTLAVLSPEGNMILRSQAPEQTLTLTVEQWEQYAPEFSKVTQQRIVAKITGYECYEHRTLVIPAAEFLAWEQKRIKIRKNHLLFTQQINWPHWFFLAVKRDTQKGLMVRRKDLRHKLLFIDIMKVGTGVHALLRDVASVGDWSFYDGICPSSFGWEVDEEAQEFISRVIDRGEGWQA